MITLVRHPMTRPPESAQDDAAASAAGELASLQAQIEALRAVLAGLLDDVAQAERRLNRSQVAQLVEANEQLLFASLRSLSVAETATHALTEATRWAELDPLTNLPNRIRLLDRFVQGAALARRHGGRMALLFVDLDNFKQVNDGMGHALGDHVLIHAAHRLASVVRDADTVSRFGGDEFVILLSELAHRSDATRLAAKLQVALAVPGSLGDRMQRLSASIGISIYPDDGEDVDELISLADAAMYRAKRSGPGRIACHGDAAASGHRSAKRHIAFPDKAAPRPIESALPARASPAHKSDRSSQRPEAGTHSDTRSALDLNAQEIADLARYPRLP